MRYKNTIYFEKPEGMNKYEYMTNLIYEGYFSLDEEGMLYSHLTKRHHRNEFRDKKIVFHTQTGYMRAIVKLIDRKTMELRLHRLVWWYFYGEIPEGKQINHIDGNKQNNKIENLELVTPSENIQHAIHVTKKFKINWNSKRAKYPKSVYEKIKSDIRKGIKPKRGSLELNMNPANAAPNASQVNAVPAVGVFPRSSDFEPKTNRIPPRMLNGAKRAATAKH